MAVKTDRIEHSAAIAQYAKAKNVDTQRAGKLFRSRLRSQFATLVQNDPAQYGDKGTQKQSANDRRPWGDHKRSTLVAVFGDAFKA